MAVIVGKLSDASGVISEAIEGAIHKLSDSPPAWDGTLRSPTSLSEKIRSGSEYRLDIDGGTSIRVILGTIKANDIDPASKYVAYFSTRGAPDIPGWAAGRKRRDRGAREKPASAPWWFTIGADAG